jgi:hypothetical protein
LWWDHRSVLTRTAGGVGAWVLELLPPRSGTTITGTIIITATAIIAIDGITTTRITTGTDITTADTGRGGGGRQSQV